MTGALTPKAYSRLWAISLALTALIFLACMFIGPGEVGTSHLNFGWPDRSIWDLRLLRIASAGLVGFGLASAGVTLQALLRNPLADPYVLGISSGSSVGVFLWLLAGNLLLRAANYARPIQTLVAQGKLIPAVAGAILTCIVVFLLARPRRGSGRGAGADPLTLLLVGVVVSSINGALLLFLNSLAPAGVQLNFLAYVMGSISNDVTFTTLLFAGIILAAGYLPMVLAGGALNIGSLSDVEAASLGVNVARLRTRCFLSASITTGAAIMLSGPIGFVGLICPHICRRLIGADHRRLIVAAPFCGAAFLMAADTFVNATGGLFHGELPVGVITALCGGPFFLYLLHRRGAIFGGDA